MVEVKYSPIKEIVIHEIIKSNLQDFIHMKVQPRQQDTLTIPFRWIDGIVFTFGGIIATEKLVHERAEKGVVHWDYLEFAEMPKFNANLVNPDNGATWRVIDGSNNTAVVEVIQWLKGQSQWFPISQIAET